MCNASFICETSISDIFGNSRALSLVFLWFDAVGRLFVVDALLSTCFIRLLGADLEIDENAMLSRHEEDRVTQAEKNKRMQEQLQVSLQPPPLPRPNRHYTRCLDYQVLRPLPPKLHCIQFICCVRSPAYMYVASEAS